jgi:anti-anti-sigma factor
MATSPFPLPQLNLHVDRAPYQSTIQCNGRITSDTVELLKTTAKPLFSASNIVILDLTNVSYMDSSGLGAIVALYVSAKAAHSQLKLVNLNQRLKELFSITRLGEVLTGGRDPAEPGLP